MKKKINVRVEEKLYNQVKELAEIEGLTTTGFLGIIIRKGIIGFKETGIQPTQTEEKAPKIDVEFLESEGEKAAKNGDKQLHKWLNSLTPQEQNAIKFSIKPWREAAKKADFDKELANLPDLIKKGDDLSLQGTAIFMPWWENLSKEIRAQLEHTHWPKWRFDKGRADNHIRGGAKPLGYSTYDIHLRQKSGLDDDNSAVLAEMEREYERAKKGTLIE